MKKYAISTAKLYFASSMITKLKNGYKDVSWQTFLFTCFMHTQLDIWKLNYYLVCRERSFYSCLYQTFMSLYFNLISLSKFLKNNYKFNKAKEITDRWRQAYLVQVVETHDMENWANSHKDLDFQWSCEPIYIVNNLHPKGHGNIKI